MLLPDEEFNTSSLLVIDRVRQIFQPHQTYPWTLLQERVSSQTSMTKRANVPDSIACQHLTDKIHLIQKGRHK